MAIFSWQTDFSKPDFMSGSFRDRTVAVFEAARAYNFG
jgi:hypothetical protein